MAFWFEVVIGDQDIAPPEIFILEMFARTIPEMRLALVAGVRRKETTGGSLYVSKRQTITIDITLAEIFPFNSDGSRQAILVSKALEMLLPDHWSGFVSKVLVVGDLDHPEEVALASTLEEDRMDSWEIPGGCVRRG